MNMDTTWEKGRQFELYMEPPLTDGYGCGTPATVEARHVCPDLWRGCVPSSIPAGFGSGCMVPSGTNPPDSGDGRGCALKEIERRYEEVM